MSIKIMSHVWDSGITDKGELLVMLALADFSNDKGECWPAVSTIAEKARMTPRSVQRVCRALQDKGVLQISSSAGQNGCNLYRLTPDACVTPDIMSPLTQTTPPPDTDDTPPLTPVSPEPSLNHNQEPSDRKRDTNVSPKRAPSLFSANSIPEKPETPVEILQQVVREETARDFAAHRKAMKKPLTVEAARRLVKTLANHPDPDAVFDLSIENGWLGVFPKKVGGPRNEATSDSGADFARRAAERYAQRVLREYGAAPQIGGKE